MDEATSNETIAVILVYPACNEVEYSWRKLGGDHRRTEERDDDNSLSREQ